MPYPNALLEFADSKEAKNFDISYKLNDSFFVYEDLKKIEAKYPGFTESLAK